MAPTPHKKPIQFEQATARLEEIVELLDNPATGLEDMISLVEEGLSLIRSGKELLHKAELRIRTLENPDQEPSEPEPETPDKNDGFDLL